MLFLIDFLKKGCELFSLFFWFLSTLCVCRLSIKFDLLPPPSIESQCVFKRKKKKVNKWTIRSVCHFSQAFIWMVRKSVMAIQMSCFVLFFLHTVHTAHPRTCRVQLICFTVVTPILVIFFFTFSYQLIICSPYGGKFVLGSWHSYNSLD